MVLLLDPNAAALFAVVERGFDGNEHSARSPSHIVDCVTTVGLSFDPHFFDEVTGQQAETVEASVVNVEGHGWLSRLLSLRERGKLYTTEDGDG